MGTPKRGEIFLTNSQDFTNHNNYHFTNTIPAAFCKQTQKYGWRLVDIEETGCGVLPFDCVFEGLTEFPKSYYDTEEESKDA